MSEALPDYYAVLGVARSASEEEIQHAYRQTALRVHPDRNPRRRDLAPTFPDIRVVNEAWDVLGDPARRAAYDRSTVPPEPVEEQPRVTLPPVPHGFQLYVGREYTWARLMDEHLGALSLEAESGDFSGLEELDDEDLWILDARDVPMRDPDLRAVARFSRLEVLLLDGSSVTDEGLDRLHLLPLLHTVTLAECDITDGGATALASIRTLQTLGLYRTGITDAAMAAFDGHPALAALDIRGTQVHGEGINYLTSLPKLRELNVSGSAERAAKRLFARRPEIFII